eukprot:8621613-Karenia_brevis.AAC.1
MNRNHSDFGSKAFSALLAKIKSSIGHYQRMARRWADMVEEEEEEMIVMVKNLDNWSTMTLDVEASDTVDNVK